MLLHSSTTAYSGDFVCNSMFQIRCISLNYTPITSVHADVTHKEKIKVKFHSKNLNFSAMTDALVPHRRPNQI